MFRRIKLHPSGREVECRDGDTVLAALERVGYALPNNCRAGACGECKVKVRSGRFAQGLVLDMALASDERRAGYGLMCMAKPLSDELQIEWGTSDAQPRLFPPRDAMLFVVLDKIVRTPSIAELVLRPLGPPMRYWPGQYVMLCDRDRKVPPRNYSIACAPRTEGEIVLQVTRIEGGAASAWIHETLALGELVNVSGPYGTFIGDPSVETAVLCMAAGSAFAPSNGASHALLVSIGLRA